MGERIGGRAVMLIAAAALLALLCGAGATSRLSSLNQRGLPPWRVKEMVYPVADLDYVSAVRLRVLEIRDALETREADKGVLSSDDEALLDLCNRLHDELIAPTERAALNNDDPAVFASLASVLAARGDRQDDNLAFDGDAGDLEGLITDIRKHVEVLRLPIVVPGGRTRLGVSYLLTITLMGYLAFLLTVLLAIVLAVRSGYRAAALRGLSLFWGLGTVFAVYWSLFG